MKQIVKGSFIAAFVSSLTICLCGTNVKASQVLSSGHQHVMEEENFLETYTPFRDCFLGNVNPETLLPNVDNTLAESNFPVNPANRQFLTVMLRRELLPSFEVGTEYEFDEIWEDFKKEPAFNNQSEQDFHELYLMAEAKMPSLITTPGGYSFPHGELIAENTIIALIENMSLDVSPEHKKMSKFAVWSSIQERFYIDFDELIDNSEEVEVSVPPRESIDISEWLFLLGIHPSDEKNPYVENMLLYFQEYMGEKLKVLSNQEIIAFDQEESPSSSPFLPTEQELTDNFLEITGDLGIPSNDDVKSLFLDVLRISQPGQYKNRFWSICMHMIDCENTSENQQKILAFMDAWASEIYSDEDNEGEDSGDEYSEGEREDEYTSDHSHSLSPNNGSSHQNGSNYQNAFPNDGPCR